jgi:hypothetical protein
MKTFSRKMKMSAIGASVILGLGVSAAIMIPSANAENPASAIPTAATSSIPSIPSISKFPTNSTISDDVEISDSPVVVISDVETVDSPVVSPSNLQSDGQLAITAPEGETENNQVGNSNDSKNND